MRVLIASLWRTPKHPNMCGIAGIWSAARRVDETLVRSMTDRLIHRGPDAGNSWVAPHLGLGLGHRRLSIVDLSPNGSQPMASRTGRFRVVFNGEIYNFRALRASYFADDCEWRGSSDTEVVVALLERFGVLDAVAKLAGMFALGIWDEAERELWLIRDRLGEKPLYFSEGGNEIAFASELSALTCLDARPRSLDLVSIHQFLRHGCVSGARSIYEGISKVLPGYALRFSRGANDALLMREVQYWSASDTAVAARNNRPSSVSLDDAASTISDTLRTIVSEQMVADVPLGAFLSGGIDSSLTVATMQSLSPKPVRTFTVAFADKSVDESEAAGEIASILGTAHTKIELDPVEALALIPELPGIYGEPFADSSQLPTLLVCKAIREHVTVALSGDGGDELFAGYQRYSVPDRLGALLHRQSRFVTSLISASISLVPSGFLEHALEHAGGETWPPSTIARVKNWTASRQSSGLYEDRQAIWVAPAMVLKDEYTFNSRGEQSSPLIWPDVLSDVERMQLVDTVTYLPDDVLVKVDRAAMHWSLETRAPLLDHRMFQAAWALPEQVKHDAKSGKLVLRHILKRFLPQALVDRPKSGFSVPLAAWLRGDLREWGEAMLEHSLASWSPLRHRVLERIWNEHQSKERDHAERLWTAFTLLQWISSTRFATKP